MDRRGVSIHDQFKRRMSDDVTAVLFPASLFYLPYSRLHTRPCPQPLCDSYKHYAHIRVCRYDRKNLFQDFYGYDVRTCRYDVSVCRYDVRACRYDVSVCRYDVSVCRYDVRACQYEVNVCRRDVTACRYDVRACRYTGASGMGKLDSGMGNKLQSGRCRLYQEFL